MTGHNHYDIKIQMIMKGVGNAATSVELPAPGPGFGPHSYSLTVPTDQLGTQAVVCYTARTDSQPPRRWTGTFDIQSGGTYGRVGFTAAREPTLEPASDETCGGLKATKATAAPPAATPRTPTSVPMSTPTSNVNPYKNNPNFFAQVEVHVMRARTATGRPGWQLIIQPSPLRPSDTHYDVKLQVVMKDVGDAGTNVELPTPEPDGRFHDMYRVVGELGRGTVVCYSARTASQPAQRWTGVYKVQIGATSGSVALVPAAEPTLEAASDAPCGGLKAARQ